MKKLSILFILPIFVAKSLQSENLNCRLKPGCDVNHCDPSPSSWTRPGSNIDEYLQKKQFPITCEAPKKKSSDDVLRLYSINADNQIEIKELNKNFLKLQEIINKQAAEIKKLKQQRSIPNNRDFLKLQEVVNKQAVEIEKLKNQQTIPNYREMKDLRKEIKEVRTEAEDLRNETNQLRKEIEIFRARPDETKVTGGSNDQLKVKQTNKPGLVDLWGEWTACSDTCGGGTQLRFAICADDGCFPGVQTRECNTKVCQDSGQGSLEILLDWSPCSVSCGGGEQTRIKVCLDNSCITDLQTRECNTEVCQDSRQVKEGQLRLVGGNTNKEGRVEIYHEGEWGTICDDLWDLEDGNVVCRNLGFNKAVEAPINAHFGRGKGKIWVYKVDCEGNEAVFSDCSLDMGDRKDWCRHTEDSSVICD